MSDATKQFGVRFYFIFFVILMGMMYFFFEDALQKQWNPNQEVKTQGETVVLKRNKYGHYILNGLINEQPVRFMLDTGATRVAIPLQVAERLDLQKGRKYQTSTANGLSTSYDTTLETLSFGNIHLQNVKAGIAAGFEGEEILLGMSALKQLEFTQKGDTLIIKQP